MSGDDSLKNKMNNLVWKWLTANDSLTNNKKYVEIFNSHIGNSEQVDNKVHCSIYK